MSEVYNFGKEGLFFLILSLCIYRRLMFRSFNPLARMMDELVVVIVAGTLWSVISPCLCLSCSIERNHNDGTIYRKEVRKKKKRTIVRLLLQGLQVI